MTGVVMFDVGNQNSTVERRWRKLSCALRSLVTRSLKIAALLAMIAFATSLGGPLSARADDDPFQKTTGGLEVDIGLMRAAIVKGHPVAHAEATMHNGPPSGRHEYHLVVAVFDATTGQRISDAAVKARISELGLVGSDIALEPMKIADTITYGGFVSFPSPTRYTIRVDVARPNAALVSFDFSYDHQPP